MKPEEALSRPYRGDNSHQNVESPHTSSLCCSLSFTYYFYEDIC